jgi:hypothetical protein
LTVGYGSKRGLEHLDREAMTHMATYFVFDCGLRDVRIMDSEGFAGRKDALNESMNIVLSIELLEVTPYVSGILG